MAENSPELFSLAPDQRKKRGSNRDELAALKKDYGIWTNLMHESASVSGRNWLAVCVPRAIAALEGYSLTPEELAEPILLYAGYGRLIDEAGLCTEGHKTEYAAVKALCQQME